MTTKSFVISEALRNGVINYLATRPFSEVAEAVPALMQLPEFWPSEAALLDDASGEEYVHANLS